MKSSAINPHQMAHQKKLEGEIKGSKNFQVCRMSPHGSKGNKSCDNADIDVRRGAEQSADPVQVNGYNQVGKTREDIDRLTNPPTQTLFTSQV